MQRIGVLLFVYDMRSNCVVLTLVCPIKEFNGIYVNSIFQQQRSVAMAPTMEGDVLTMDASIQTFNGRETKRHQVNPSKQEASSSSGRMSHS